MKKILWMVIIVGMVLSIAFPREGICQPRPTQIRNLYSVLEDAQEIRVYIAPVTDSSGQASDMLKDTRKTIEEAFISRMSLNFKVVPEKDADIIITCDIVERIWLEHDPLDSDKLPGTPGLLLDAAMDENYGRIQADVVVKRGPQQTLSRDLGRLRKGGDILWKKQLKATVTRGDMPEEESKPYIEARLAAMILRKCFGKKAKRQ
ncbi:hypothetical protein ACFL5E_02285 [Candidatus Omnitrophota bacterium]